jgi:hypothetical protein
MRLKVHAYRDAANGRHCRPALAQPNNRLRSATPEALPTRRPPRKRSLSFFFRVPESLFVRLTARRMPQHASRNLDFLFPASNSQPLIFPDWPR